VPYLKQIANQINVELKASVFNDKRFSSAEFNAIAYPVMVDNRDDRQQISPCIPLSAGEYKQMMFDDTKSFVLYHKILSKSYQRVENDGSSFGRVSGRNMRAVTQMQMVFLCNRDIIKILTEELEALVVTNFPDGKETGFKTISSSILGVDIKPVNSDFDYTRLWIQEFKGYEFNVNPDRAMLSVNYTIESTFKTKCFKLCDCQTQ